MAPPRASITPVSSSYGAALSRGARVPCAEPGVLSIRRDNCHLVRNRRVGNFRRPLAGFAKRRLRSYYRYVESHLFQPPPVTANTVVPGPLIKATNERAEPGQCGIQGMPLTLGSKTPRIMLSIIVSYLRLTT
jgi:hypothetical protein